ncbi:MAG TPA: FAD-dependent oxidoreductase, partial [Aestuariivirga sp.]
MKTQARVVVIGGGVVGVSTLYHLAKKGWSDVVLVERKELTSGSTWHAAGLLPLFNLSYSVGQIHKYSVKLYGELEAETGQHVGFSKVSNIRVARTKDRWDEFMYYAGIAETIGVPVNILTPEQVKEVWPLCETDGILGAIQHPDDGYIQPA